MGTSMKLNLEVSTGGGGAVDGSSFLVEKELKVTIEGSTNKYIPILVSFNKYDIRTLYVANNSGNKSVSTIFDKSIDGNLVYKSLEEVKTYDIANVPCTDKEGSQLCHLFIENKSAVSAEFHIILKVTSLQ